MRMPPSVSVVNKVLQHKQEQGVGLGLENGNGQTAIRSYVSSCSDKVVI